jgi:hypothetical protein
MSNNVPTNDATSRHGAAAGSEHGWHASAANAAVHAARDDDASWPGARRDDGRRQHHGPTQDAANDAWRVPRDGRASAGIGYRDAAKPIAVGRAVLKTSLNSIPAGAVNTVWPLVANYVKRALHVSNGEMEEDDVREFCVSGRWQLWIGWQNEAKRAFGFCTTELCQYPRRRTCILRLMAADGGPEQWLPHLGLIEQWARDEGCVAIEIVARKGWLKVLKEYRHTAVLLMKGI